MPAAMLMCCGLHTKVQATVALATMHRVVVHLIAYCLIIAVWQQQQQQQQLHGRCSAECCRMLTQLQSHLT